MGLCKIILKKEQPKKKKKWEEGKSFLQQLLSDRTQDHHVNFYNRKQTS